MIARTEQGLKRYVRALRKRDDLRGFFRALNYCGEAFLFGGAPRDVAFGMAKKVNDLDIFVSGPIDLVKLGPFSSVLRQTNFGGFRLCVGSFHVDAWEINKSRVFRKVESPLVNVAELLKSVCFSTDGVAVSLKTGKVAVTPAFRRSLDNRLLDFVNRPSELEPVAGARIARLALKLDLKLSVSVATYFQDCLEAFGRDGLIVAERRWGESSFLSELLIAHIEAQMCGQRSVIYVF